MEGERLQRATRWPRLGQACPAQGQWEPQQDLEQERNLNRLSLETVALAAGEVRDERAEAGRWAGGSSHDPSDRLAEGGVVGGGGGVGIKGDRWVGLGPLCFFRFSSEFLPPTYHAFILLSPC